MSKKRLYQRQSVNEVDRDWLRDRAVGHGDAGTTVGLDVAKHEIVVCVRWADGRFERPWSVKNPTEIGLLIELLQQLKELCGSLTIGMESTGTYGDAVRLAMTEAFLEVHRVNVGFDVLLVAARADVDHLVLVLGLRHHLPLELEVGIVASGAVNTGQGRFIFYNVGPLLRHVRPVGSVGRIVRWEGIVTDPIGAIFAVLVFQAFLHDFPYVALEDHYQ